MNFLVRNPYSHVLQEKAITLFFKVIVIYILVSSALSIILVLLSPQLGNTAELIMAIPAIGLVPLMYYFIGFSSSGDKGYLKIERDKIQYSLSSHPILKSEIDSVYIALYFFPLQLLSHDFAIRYFIPYPRFIISISQKNKNCSRYVLLNVLNNVERLVQELYLYGYDVGEQVEKQLRVYKISLFFIMIFGPIFALMVLL